jgi:soluble lytic murein transglycosylase-like protein
MSRGSAVFDSIISEASQAWAVPFSLIKAIIERESDFNPNAYRAEPQIGDASRGLMQLLLGTAQALGFSGAADDLYDPTLNIRLGTRYLRDLIGTATRSGYGIDSAISAYNAGFSGQRTGDGKRTGDTTDTPFINQSYVDAVISAANAYASEAVGGVQQLPTVVTMAAQPTTSASGTGSNLMLQLLLGVLIAVIAAAMLNDD